MVSDNFVESHIGLKQDLLEILQGDVYPHQVREKLRYTPRGFHRTISALGLVSILDGGPINEQEIFNIRRSLGESDDSDIDLMIDMGLTLREMEKLHGKSRTAYDQYIKGSGQNAFWKKKKEDRVREETTHKLKLNINRSNLLGLINTKIVNPGLTLAQNSSVEETVQYYLNKYVVTSPDVGRKPDLNRLAKLLTVYFERKRDNQHPSLNQLARESGYSHGIGVDYILQQMGLPSLNGRYDKLDKDELKILRRAKKTLFSSADVKYFARSDAGLNTISGVLHGGRNNISRTIIVSQGGDIGTNHGHYWQASQVYQAQDLGFERDEIDILFSEVNPLVLKKIVDERERISQIIIKGLRTMYANNSINTPYLP